MKWSRLVGPRTSSLGLPRSSRGFLGSVEEKLLSLQDSPLFCLLFRPESSSSAICALAAPTNSRGVPGTCVTTPAENCVFSRNIRWIGPPPPPACSCPPSLSCPSDLSPPLSPHFPSGSSPPGQAAKAAASCTLMTTSTSSDSQASAERRFRCYTRTGDGGFSSLFSGERRQKADAVFDALGDVDELNSTLGLAQEHCFQQGGLEELCTQLSTIQSRLLDVGSAVATPLPSASAARLKRVQFDPTGTATLESWLDAMDDLLPPLTNFILPSGGLAAAHLHVARAVCRRAERAVVGLNLHGAQPTLLAQEEQEEGSTASLTNGACAPTRSGAGAAAETGERPRQGSAVGGRVSPEDGVDPGRQQQQHVVVDPAVVKYLNRLSDYLFTAARFAALKAGRKETIYKKSVA